MAMCGKVAASVDELAEVFAEYWRPYWGRDDPVEASQLACDAQCQQLLDELSHDLCCTKMPLGGKALPKHTTVTTLSC